ncbi:hypothetical protein L1987_86929 [Smallanthus sonchifolius]|uniref:Uncharacterized protein n=1 Tax=Smallanthus sonchifolius TaxID=185202 RepID=A0ACB8XZY2_9ASTR|nr:hypothetical protein L1987_86929 [Smallanthus sonchifolius]
MNQVLSKLEKALELQHKHDHLEAVAVEGTPSNHLKVTLQDRGLDHFRLKLSDIELATNNFSETFCIGSGGFGKALQFQEDYEIWEPKLPIDYEEIIRMSKYSELVKTKKDLYDMFVKGILLQDGKALFSLGSCGERNEMISARTFSYKKTSYMWQSVQESRFSKAAELFDVKNEEGEDVEQILKLNSNKDQLLSVNENGGKEHLMLSAMEVLYDSSNSKYFRLQSSIESRLGWENSLFVFPDFENIMKILK